MITPFSAIIPAAGNSRRMGQHKALLEYLPGQTFAEYLTSFYSSFGCNRVILILNPETHRYQFSDLPCNIVINRHTDRGRSFSIELGLAGIHDGHLCFIHNIDNPCIDKTLLDLLLRNIAPDSFVVPVYEGRGGHPVLLGEEVVDYLKGLEKLEDFRNELKRFRRIEVEYPDERICWNINTEENYMKFLNSRT